MIIKTHSYRFAEEILSCDDFKPIKEELYDICKKCPVPIYPGKSQRQTSKDVVQQVMNTYFRIQFENNGWEKEPLATPDENADELRADFRKKFVISENQNVTLQIEVEFGNIASSYRNYFKFQLSFSYGLTDLCVLIVPSNELANRIDSGVSNYEKCIREIEQAKMSVTVPTIVIGLFDTDDMGNRIPQWNMKDEGVDVEVAKRANNAVAEEHDIIVKRYIEEYCNETP